MPRALAPQKQTLPTSKEWIELPGVKLFHDSGSIATQPIPSLNILYSILTELPQDVRLRGFAYLGDSEENAEELAQRYALLAGRSTYTTAAIEVPGSWHHAKRSTPNTYHDQNLDKHLWCSVDTIPLTAQNPLHTSSWQQRDWIEQHQLAETYGVCLEQVAIRRDELVDLKAMTDVNDALAGKADVLSDLLTTWNAYQRYKQEGEPDAMFRLPPWALLPPNVRGRALTDVVNEAAVLDEDVLKTHYDWDRFKITKDGSVG